MLPRAARRDVRIETALDERLQVSGDAFLLQRAIANLLRRSAPPREVDQGK